MVKKPARAAFIVSISELIKLLNQKALTMFVSFKLLYYQNINEFEADCRVEVEMRACCRSFTNWFLYI